MPISLSWRNLRPDAMGNFRAIRRVLIYTMILNLLVTGTKLLVGYLTGSLSLIADGFDSLFDGLSNVIGLVGIYVAARPPDTGHPYGHRKYETLSAIVIVVLLFVTTVELAQSAVERLRHPVVPEVNVWTFVALAISVGMHLYVSVYERARGKALKSEFLVADALHTRADVLVSVSVVVGMIVVRLGFPVVDAILALVIAGMIAKIGIDIVRDSTKVLVDAASVDVAEVQRILGNVPGVLTYHRIRSRGQEDDIHLDLHVRVQPGIPVEQAHHIAHQVQQHLLEGIEGLRDVVIHIEPEEGSAPTQPDIDLRIREIASRIPGVAVHGIRAYDLQGRLYIALHLEVERSLPIEAAHELADQLEDMLRKEVPNAADVEVHIEPSDHHNGHGATTDAGTRRKVQAALVKATGEVDGLSDCHDVSVSRVDGHLLVTAHCECDASLSVDAAHILSGQLERHVREQVPEVDQVIVHVEPHGA